MLDTLNQNPFSGSKKKQNKTPFTEWECAKYTLFLSLRLRIKNGRRDIRINFVGLWKNIKDTCKRAGVFFEVLEMLEIEGSIPNRGIWGYVESLWIADFYSAKWVDD